MLYLQILQRSHTISEADAQEDLSAVLAAMRLDPVASVHRLHSPAEEEKTTRAQLLQERPRI